MPKINDFYNMAKVLSSTMDNSLVVFFDDYVRNTGGLELQSQMQEWTSRAKECSQYDGEVSLLNYIWFILSSENAELAKGPRDKYFEKRRQARFYWANIIKKEKKRGFADGYLKSDCSAYFELFKVSNSGDMKKYSSEEEYLESKYSSVMAWGENKDSNLVAFPQIFHLSHKKIADYFFIDCAYRAYDTILKKMNGDVPNGYFTIMPQLVNDGLFSFTSHSKEMEAKVQDDAIIVVDTVSDRYSTVFDKIEGDFSEAVVNGTQKQLVESFVKSGKLSLINDVLDALDQRLFVKIYSQLSVADLNQGSKSFNLLTLVKSVYGGKPRREHYISTVERLKKMAKCRVEIMERNSMGNLVSGGIISFFDIIFKTGEVADSNTHTDIAIIDGSSPMDILDELSTVEDLSQLNVEVMPSQYVKKELQKGMRDLNLKVLTEIYNVDVSSKANKMLSFLLEERISIYPSVACSLPYETFTTKLRIEEPKKKRVREMIGSSIRELCETHVLVKDFAMGEYSVEIEFEPMTDIEKRMYNLEGTEERLSEVGA